MSHNSIFVFFYCGGVTPFEGIGLDGIQDKKKYNAGCNKIFLGKRHGHMMTNSNREECAHINEHFQ
jgi:hypothetical protein